MEDKKYELVPETITKFYGKPMYRIRALKDFSDVKKGDLGGYVESEENLSQEGNCWIYDNSIVGLGSKVTGNAIVKDVSVVVRCSGVSDDAIIEKRSLINESSVVCNQSRVVSAVVTNGSSIVYKSVIKPSCLIEHGSTVVSAIVGPNVHISNGAVIRFNIGTREDYVVYNTPVYYGRSLTASTKKDIWSCEPLSGTAKEVRDYLADDDFLAEDDEYLRWFDSIVSFHKNYFNIK